VAAASSATWGTPARAYNAEDDGYVAKLDSNGGLAWNTFLGGSGYDYCTAVGVDGSGNLLVTGYSNATWQGTNPPVRAYTSSLEEAFVAMLDSGGGLTWSTFLGGSGVDLGLDIALDGNGNAVVAGQSNASWQGANPPVRAYTAGPDAFAAKLDSSGGLTWNTFLGGSGVDSSYAIEAVGSDDVVLAGYSNAAWQGTNPPVRAFTAISDVFAARLDSNGGLAWNTFLGGSGADYSWDVAVDGNGFIYVAGRSSATWGTPVIAYTASSDALAARLDGSGKLTWNAFLGGSGIDSGYTIAVDGSGNVVVGGRSGATWGSPIRAYTSAGDAFIVKLPPYNFVYLPLMMR